MHFLLDCTFSKTFERFSFYQSHDKEKLCKRQWKVIKWTRRKKMIKIHKSYAVYTDMIFCHLFSYKIHMLSNHTHTKTITRPTAPKSFFFFLFFVIFMLMWTLFFLVTSALRLCVCRSISLTFSLCLYAFHQIFWLP